jgi:hypothetical protein
MNREEDYQEIESSIIVLGAAYAASLKDSYGTIPR